MIPSGTARQYVATFYRTGQVQEGDRLITTKMRSKELAIQMFQKWFGRTPTKVDEKWDTAWAGDKRGNLVIVDEASALSPLIVFSNANIRGLLLPEKCEAA